jgi:hypothetical protein
MMSWETYRQRSRVLDGVLNDVAASGSRRVPARWRPEIDEAFGGEAGFAQALYARWFAALTARLDPVLEAWPADLPDTAARVARQLARERPALFGLLAAYSGHSALEGARQRDRHYLDWAPGAQLAALAARPDDLLQEADAGGAPSDSSPAYGDPRSIVIASV